MFNKLVVKLLFAGYNRKFKKIESKNLTNFQKAVLFTRYYLPRQNLATKLVSTENLGNYWARSVRDLNLLCGSQTSTEYVRWGEANFYFSEFVGLRLDRGLARNLIKRIFKLLLRAISRVLDQTVNGLIYLLKLVKKSLNLAK